MAGTSPTSADDLNDFLAGLTPEGRRHFVALERALAVPDRSLRWYHGIGQLAIALRGEANCSRYGTYWIHRLGRALGVSHNMLTKPIAFAQRFTAATDLAELERLKVSWSAVIASMSLGDRDQQLALLQEAAAKGWYSTKLELVVRQRLGDRRQPRTGRMPKKADTPALELEDLLTRTRALCRYLDTRWLVGESALLPRLQQTSRKRLGATLRGLLMQAEETLNTAAGKIDQLLKGLREVDGNGRRPTSS